MFGSFLKQWFDKVLDLKPKSEENLGDESSIIHLMNEVIPQNLGIQNQIRKKENTNGKKIKVS